jgi:hypothetical protein
MKKDKSNVNKKNEEAKRKAEENKKNELNKVLNTLHSAEIDANKTQQTHWTIIGTKNIPKALREQGEYVTLFQNFGWECDEKKEDFTPPISEEACIVFVYFLFNMSWFNWVYITKKKLSKLCGLGKNRVRVTRALNELIELGLIQAIKDKENPNVIHYRVDIHAGWKGSMTAWANEHEANKKGEIKIDWNLAKSIQEQESKRSEKGWDSLNNRKENDNE